MIIEQEAREKKREEEQREKQKAKDNRYLKRQQTINDKIMIEKKQKTLEQQKSNEFLPYVDSDKLDGVSYKGRMADMDVSPIAKNSEA